MKSLFINASPRKNWNTAKVLKSAMEGAKSIGAETEYVDLYDLNFTGCRSCLICKLKGKEPCKCYWMDDLPELIDKIFHAKSVFFGTPNYLGRPTSQFLGLLERLHFCSLSYDDYSNHFKGKVSVGLFITMNANEEMYNKLYKNAFEEYIYGLRHLNGEVIVSPCFDTLQVGDYSRYNMSSFNEKMKIESNKNKFPHDLQKAFEIGRKLNE